mgnify:FL=1
MMGKYKKMNVEQAGDMMDGLLRKKETMIRKKKNMGSRSLSEADIKKLMKMLQS